MPKSIVDILSNAPNQPIICPVQEVEREWIDYNGHLNMAFYNVLFDRAVDHVYDHLGIGADYAASGEGSCFTVEVHLHYAQELALGDEVEIHFQLLGFDSKRIHFFEQMFHKTQGYLAATSEQMGLHVSMESRRAAPFPDRVLGELQALQQAHAGIPTPTQVGHVMGIPTQKR